MMETRVAQRYILSSHTYYHGTSYKDALEIQKRGFSLQKMRGHGAFLGPGVYLSGSYPSALDYARDYANGDWTGTPEDAGVLHLSINPKKPLSANPQEWPPDFITLYETYTGEPAKDVAKGRNFRELGRLARKHGYDAIVYHQGTSVVFDPSRIKVTQVDYLPKDVNP